MRGVVGIHVFGRDVAREEDEVRAFGVTFGVFDGKEGEVIEEGGAVFAVTQHVEFSKVRCVKEGTPFGKGVFGGVLTLQE